jgi:hypothetical protein
MIKSTHHYKYIYQINLYFNLYRYRFNIIIPSGLLINLRDKFNSYHNITNMFLQYFQKILVNKYIHHFEYNDLTQFYILDTLKYFGHNLNNIN